MVVALTGVPARVLTPLAVGAVTPLGSAGWQVTAVDAGHCPGAVMLLFEGPDGARTVHTGDCRAAAAVLAQPALRAFCARPVARLVLDTTYGHPRHELPAAAGVAAAVADRVRAGLAAAAAGTGPDTLYLLQCYNVGKEELLAAVGQAAAANGRKVSVSADRLARLATAAPVSRGGLDPSLFSATLAPTDVRVAVVPWGSVAESWPYLRPDFTATAAAARRAGADACVAFVPTGWAATRGRGAVERDGVTVEPVPYSEHSSFAELRALVSLVRPATVEPAVAAGAREARAIAARFADLLDGRAAAAALLRGGRAAPPPCAPTPPLPPPPDVKPDPAPPSPDAAAADSIAAALGGAVDRGQAGLLLTAAGGDAALALNAYLDGSRPWLVAPTRGSGAASGAKRPRSAAAGPSPAKKAAPAAGQRTLNAFFGGGGGVASPRAPRAASTAKPEPPPAPPLVRPLAPRAPPPAPSLDATTLARPLADFDPVAGWPAGTPPPYAAVAAALAAVDATKSRLAIGRVYANLFRALLAAGASGDCVAGAGHLLLGAAAPAHAGVELGVGPAIVSAAIKGATGASAASLRAAARKAGDLGDAAASLRGGQAFLGRPPPPLTIPGVVEGLLDIARATGAGAAAAKQARLHSLLRAARSPDETRFLVRTALGCVRVGAGWRSVLPALGAALAAHAGGVGGAERAADLAVAAKAATAAYSRCPSLPVLVAAALEEGPASLAGRPVTPGVPPRPMLATAVRGAAPALARLGGASFLAEWKYDGVRCQAHVGADGGVALFSRGGENATPAFPDVAAALAAALLPEALPAVLDAEVCAVERAADGGRERLLAFQTLAARPRAGQTASAAAAAAPVTAYLFDALVLGGEDITATPLRARRAVLAAALAPGARGVTLAEAVEIEPPDAGAGAGAGAGAAEGDDLRVDALEAALAAAAAGGAEGLMLKALDGPPGEYVPAARSLAWLKLKVDYTSSGGDGVDAVVVGAWRGHGRKKDWLSPLLLAVRSDDGSFASVCRVMSGFSDAAYGELTARLTPLARSTRPSSVSTRDTPPMWFDPAASEVWEVKGAELSASRVHTAALGRVPGAGGDRGLALRFPRFVRARPDKKVGEATAAATLVAAYAAQARRLGPEAAPPAAAAPPASPSAADAGWALAGGADE